MEIVASLSNNKLVYGTHICLSFYHNPASSITSLKINGKNSDTMRPYFRDPKQPKLQWGCK